MAGHGRVLAARMQLKEIGGRFLTARLALDMTLREAADAARLSNAFLSQVENGNSRISLDRAAKLAVVYGVSLNWLACGREQEDFTDRERAMLDELRALLSRLQPPSSTQGDRNG